MPEYCLLLEAETPTEILLDIDTVLRGFSRLCGDSVLDFVRSVHKGKIVGYMRVVTNDNDCVSIAKTLVITVANANIRFRSISCKNPFGYQYLEQKIIV